MAANNMTESAKRKRALVSEIVTLLEVQRSVTKKLQRTLDCVESAPDSLLDKLESFVSDDRQDVCGRTSSYFPVAKPYVYVLLLENEKYYVGYSARFATRMNDHFFGEGALWTQRHKPLEVVEVSTGGPDEEREKTLEYMRRFGYENVRGSSWCKIELKAPPTCMRVDNACLLT